MRAVFISYRRDDSEGEAGRLFDDLVAHFGDGCVFMDVAALEAGQDFRKELDESVAGCGVLLSVIGKDWLTVKTEAGGPRLDDPMDFVRLETASALKRDIPVIPVLVRGAKMPRAEQLPEGLKELAFRNAVELTHARWGSDLTFLVGALERVLKKGAPVPAAAPERVVAAEPSSSLAQPAWRKPLFAALALCVLLGAGWAALHHGTGEPAAPAPVPVAPDGKPVGSNGGKQRDLIAAKYAQMGGASGVFGKALTSEAAAPSGGIFVDYENGYSVYATQVTGAHFVHGAIKAKWLERGGPSSPLGYPITDEIPEGGGFVQKFANGTISWTEAGGVHIRRAGGP